MKTAVRTISALALFTAGVVVGLGAQPLGDIAQRSELKRADLSGASGMEVVSSVVEIKPGESTELHFHHGVETAYVLQGGTVEVPGGQRVALAGGATLMNLRDVRHGAFRNVGDAPVRFFTVHVVDKGKPLYDFSK